VTKKKKPLEYISVNVPKLYILNALETTFDGQSRNKTVFYRALQEARRVQPAFHVTLIHKASAKQHKELWDKYSAIHQEAGAAENKLGSCDVQLERVSAHLSHSKGFC
jgi:tRNA ligase